MPAAPSTPSITAPAPLPDFWARLRASLQALGGRIAIAASWVATAFAGAWKTRRSLTLIMMTILVSLLIMGEAGRLIGETVTPDGRTHDLTPSLSVWPFPFVDSWTQWALIADRVDSFLWAHIVTDAFFIAAYIIGLRRLLPTHHGIVWALLGAEVVEDGLILAWTLVPAVRQGGWFGYVQGGASVAKWALVIVIGLLVALDRPRLRALGKWLRFFARALWVQRLPAIPVVVLVVLATFSGWALFEQLPDVQRGWFPFPQPPDWRAIVSAFLAFVFVSGCLFAIARQRSELILTAADSGPGKWPSRLPVRYWPWLAIAAIVPVVAGFFTLLGFGSFVEWGVVIGFAVVPVTLVVLSWALRLLAPKLFADENGERPDPFPLPSTDNAIEDNPERARMTTAVGDTLAAVFAAMFFIAAAKAFTGVALLSTLPQAPIDASVAASWVIVSVGAVLGVVLVPGLRGAWDAIIARRQMQMTGASSPGLMLSLLSVEVPSSGVSPGDDNGVYDGTSPGDDYTVNKVDVFRAVFAAFAGGYIVLALLRPDVAMAGGVVASCVMLLGSWTILVATFAAWLGRRRPLEVSRLFGRRTDPIVLLLILLPLVVAQAGGPPALHAIQQVGAAVDGTRPNIPKIVADWARANTQCVTEVTLPGGATQEVRPLVIAAAEGGGIRAATWTADVLKHFATGGPCTRDAILLSSGVSGGAVGLAVGHTDDPDQIDTTSLGSPVTLSAAVTGYLARDLVASITGLRFPTSQKGKAVWQDRAAIIEEGWRKDAPQLKENFDFAAKGPGGYLVLNSTAVGINCKVTVSQVDLNWESPSPPTPNDSETDTTGAADRAIDCNQADSELSDTIDLVDYYGYCPLKLDWATAAMLAARFPFITPLGRVDGRNIGTSEACADLRPLQLGDGGYLENSGLGTLSDIAPQLVEAIANQNRIAAEAGTPFIVPVVMFLSNEPGGDVVAASKPLGQELLIPIPTFINAPKNLVTPEAFLSRLSDSLFDVCPNQTTASGEVVSTPSAGACEQAVQAFRGDSEVPHGVVVVRPRTTPSLEIPLGWTLSPLSVTLLDQAVDAELALSIKTDRCIPVTSPGTATPEEQSYYATLGQLMCALAPAG